MPDQKSFYNAHTHIFTLDHVPDKFARGYFSPFGITIRISWLKNAGILRWLIKTIPKIRRSKYDAAERLVNLVKHGQKKSQEQIFKNLKGYYPTGTRFIILPMDMDYMGAGKAPKKYMEQIHELEELKKKEAYANILYPFIFADPRRFSSDKDYLPYVKEKLASGIFAGIKMYPSLGYWPFDQHLEELFDFALDHQVPITSHCMESTVHDRNPRQFHYHPIKTDVVLTAKKDKQYANHFIHPVNFHALLNPEIISGYWGKPKDYSKLKICLGHAGGPDTWKNYLKYPWIADRDDNETEDNFESLKIENWSFDPELKPHRFSWYKVIKDMVRKYDNVYADISFTLYEKETWPLIKLLLTTDEKLKTRLMFGTDYYVVAQKGSERELSISIRSYLGEDLFYQISQKNVIEFLKTDL